MLYTAEDAIQIYHAKSSTLEFFAAKVPKAAWQGIRKEDIEPAQEYYSDDIIVDFDLLDRDAYEEKVCGGAGTIGGLTNTAWDAENITSGQAATEDQLKIVSDSAIKYDVDSGGTINKNKITLEGSNGTTIGNVAAGEVSATSMDAINGSQLYAVQQDIGNIHRDINKLGDEIDTVGALSAAMAGLHPRFQDGNKGELAMAYGGYGGKSALAVGGFYAPNEKVMFSLGLGVSEGGSKMGNFGVNFALDRSRDRKAEARDIVYTRKEVDSSLAAQDEKIKLLLAKLEEQSREIEELKAKVN